MNRILRYPALHTNLAALLLRLIYGGLFIYHGYGKLLLDENIVNNFDPIGIGSRLSYYLVVFAELVCGILITIGFWTRVWVVPPFIAMIVAYFVAHGKDDFQVKELAFIFLTLSLVVFLLGSGRYSVDGAMQGRKVVSRE